MSDDQSKCRNLWRASELLERVERTLKDSGIVLPALGQPANDLESILGRIDLTTSLGRSVVGAAKAAGELTPESAVARDSEMRVEIAEDAMIVEALILPPIAGGRTLTLDRCLEELREIHGIVRGIDRLALTRLLAAAEKAPRHAARSRCMARRIPASSSPREERRGRWRRSTIDRASA